jgi:hypothetical protein
MYQQHKVDTLVKRPVIPKLLICSPSNGGCDELTRRLKAHRDHHKTKSFLSYSNKEFQIVRLGRTESMHRDCEQVYFENLVRIKLDELVRKKELEKSSSLKSHYVELETKENILKKKIKALKASSTTNPVIVCFAALFDLFKTYFSAVSIVKRSKSAKLNWKS